MPQSAIGVGRAVVEGEGWAAVVQAELAIDALVLPEGLQFRFAFDALARMPNPVCSRLSVCL